ncbi:solute carrier family 2 member 11, like isoform X2 [Paramormyrops kingsleyae]|uniref:solute carrier family 2 member 11, like isoform X2 n=1 Tax=Paramormyrops kingsleyae TaxID=1676925 RepID=UPI003B96CEF4
MTQAISLLVRSPRFIIATLILGTGGSFQYGFHISVLNSPSPFIKELVNRTCTERYNLSLEPWVLSLIWSFIVSIYCIGGILGSLFAGRLAHVYGRKKSLLFNNILAIAGATMMLLSRVADSFEMIMIGRLLYGVNSGFALVVHTLYVVECAPRTMRGIAGVSVATFVALGKFAGQLLGLRELLGSEDWWPWLLAFSGFMGILQLLTLPFLPESPHFLLLDRGDRPGCEKAMQQLWGKGDHTSEIEEMLLQRAALQGVQYRTVWELICDRTVRWQLLTVMVTCSVLQFCGINAVYMYALDVFRTAGIPSHQLQYATLGTGLCEITVSLTCAMIIESTGKRVLLIRGNLMMVAVLGLLTITLNLQKQVFWMPYCSMILIFIYIFFFGSGPAGVTIALAADIFNQAYKPAAYTVGSFLNWISLFLIGILFPVLVQHLGEFCFIIFLACCLFCAAFIWRHLPEIKNRTILEITEDFRRMHAPKRGVGEWCMSEVKTQAMKSTKL